MNNLLQKIESSLFTNNNLNVFVKRDDLIHPLISGNKWRKSHYLLHHIKESGYTSALTFGGAYSNHIHAFSYACKELGIKSIGIIRGEELSDKPLNKTLQFAQENGMELIFVSRDEYKNRNEQEYCNHLSEKFNSYIVPEGGTTKFAIKGFSEMISEINIDKALYFVPVGSGGTIAGINANLTGDSIVYGINVLKGTEIEIINVIESFSTNKKYEILSDYHFGGYAKYNEELIEFIKYFEATFKIEIESVYSAKMFFAFFDLLNKGKLKNSNIVLVHTGGLQGKRQF